PDGRRKAALTPDAIARHCGSVVWTCTKASPNISLGGSFHELDSGGGAAPPGRPTRDNVYYVKSPREAPASRALIATDTSDGTSVIGTRSSVQFVMIGHDSDEFRARPAARWTP